ncbi:hypothetical protein [Segatella buccae]|uniref:hypothetical protein n=1 Tax=Segatella buccae TaxID=28126 RepID=UPI0022E91799|nr:hypothetical protein [Segatella buccae]
MRELQEEDRPGRSNRATGPSACLPQTFIGTGVSVWPVADLHFVRYRPFSSLTEYL